MCYSTWRAADTLSASNDQTKETAETVVPNSLHYAGSCIIVYLVNLETPQNSGSRLIYAHVCVCVCGGGGGAAAGWWGSFGIGSVQTLDLLKQVSIAARTAMVSSSVGDNVVGCLSPHVYPSVCRFTCAAFSRS